MVVREFLTMWADDPSIKIMQRPIKKIDNSRLSYHDWPVHRQTAPVSMLLGSNQNYLDYEIDYLLMDDDLLIVVCSANELQETETVNAYFDGR